MPFGVDFIPKLFNFIPLDGNFIMMMMMIIIIIIMKFILRLVSHPEQIYSHPN